MYLCDDIAKLDSVPSFDKLDLYELALYFDCHLCSKNFIFICTDKHSNEIAIDLRFKTSNFAHLGGLDGKVIPSRYDSSTIYNMIIDKSWDKEKIKNFNKFTFKDAKKRLRYISLVHDILSNPDIIAFNSNLVSPKTNIKSKYLITKIYNNKYVHLGIDTTNESDHYFPRTLLIETTDKFIKDQNILTIDSKIITDYSEEEEIIETMNEA